MVLQIEQSGLTAECRTMRVLPCAGAGVPARKPSPGAVRDAAVGQGRTAYFDAGQTIFTPSQTAHACYRIISGRVEIREPLATEASETIVCGEGEVFGEIAALSGARRSSSAVAVEPIICQIFTPTAFTESLIGSDDEAAHYAASFAARLRRCGGPMLSRMVSEGHLSETDQAILPLHEALRMLQAIEDLLGVLEVDRTEAIRFARTLVASLRALARPAQSCSGRNTLDDDAALTPLRQLRQAG